MRGPLFEAVGAVEIAAADMTVEEMRAATDTAHRQGVKVSAHTGSAQATLDALVRSALKKVAR